METCSEEVPAPVRVWFILPEKVFDPQVLTACQGLLSEEERARQRRFLFEEHRRQFLVAHASLRLILSQYARVRPEEWRFTANSHGRPEICGPAVAGLNFNLSHTQGLIVCAVSGDVEMLGVDVEYSARPGITPALARRFFSAPEVARLENLPDEEFRERFFEFWTLKEAYVKARGLGIFSIPLADFSFQLGPDAAPRIRFTSAIDDVPENWQFAQLAITPRHKAALALSRSGNVDRAVILQEFRPDLPASS